MKPLSRNGLFTGGSTFAVATPIFAQDQDSTAPKRDDKTKDKPKGKPKPDRKLSDLETEAIKRIAKLDPKLAKKLAGKLPKKKTQKDQVEYIRKRIGKIADERQGLRGMEKAGLTDKKGLAKEMKRFDKIEKELKDLGAFYLFAVFPEWYKELLKKRKKKEEKKPPTTQPNPKKPTSQPGGSLRVPDGILLNFISPEGGLGI